MDWLDQYLNGLGEYKTTVSPADTHIWGVKPKLNNVQERMIFDAAAQSEVEYRQLVQEARAELEEHGMSRDDVAEGIGADPGSNIFSSILSFGVNTNNQSLVLPGNASVFEFTVGNAVSSFNLDIVGFGSFSVLNNYDENSFSNCYLSAYNLNNITISFNPVFVTASESLCSNGQLFTIYYSNTGSAIFSITKSDTLEPAPSPTPTRTPGVTVTPTISITPTRTPTPTRTLTPTVTPTISITPTRTSTPAVTPTPTSAPAFPTQITLTGDFGFINAAPPVLSPITDLSQLNAFQEILALAGVNSSTITTPYRVYLSTAPNASGGYDYIYLIYLELNTGGWYNEAISPGRWFIGNGYSFSGDNEGWYTNYGYYTALQSKSTPPSTNIANWTRIPGYYPNSGSITEISFTY